MVFLLFIVSSQPLSTVFSFSSGNLADDLFKLEFLFSSLNHLSKSSRVQFNIDNLNNGSK
jgi:hypothetical protein